MNRIILDEKFKGIKMGSEEAYGKYPYIKIKFESTEIIFPINEIELNSMKKRLEQIEIHSNRYYDEREDLDELNKERSDKLKELLNANKELFKDYREPYKRKEIKGYKLDIDGTPDNIILRAFNLKKPLSSIEIYEKDYQKVMRFINELDDFFFVGYFNEGDEGDTETFTGTIYVSRFKTLIEVILKVEDFKGQQIGLTSNIADLEGVFYGYYSLREIWEYCIKEDKMHLIK